MKNPLTDMAELLPVRADDAHKGTCGRVGIVAGSLTMLGAAVLCARAALRAGAGLVYLLTVPEALPFVSIQYPEIIVLPLPSKRGGVVSEGAADILDYIEEKKINAVAIGPGMGTAVGTAELISKTLTGCTSRSIPVVLDADGLNAVTTDILGSLHDDHVILTPHVGEFFRLFGIQPEAGQRELCARRAAEDVHQIVVLKGKGTVVCSSGESFINPSGNSALATAGSGDVLTGILVSFVGQGMGLFEAAKLGVYTHGLCGDICREEKNVYSVIASDIIESLPIAFKSIMRIKQANGKTETNR